MPKSNHLGAKAIFSALALALLAGSSAAATSLSNSLASHGDPFGKDQESPWWVGFSAGVTAPNDVDPAPGGSIQFKNGYLISGSVGYRLGSIGERVDFGVELEGLFSQANVDKDSLATISAASAEDVSNTAGLVNGVLNWRWSEKVTFSVAAGVGYSKTKFSSFNDLSNNFSILNDDTGVVAQGKAGFVYDLGGPFSWTLGYRYFRTESLNAEDRTGQTFDLTNEIHSFEVGLRYSL